MNERDVITYPRDIKAIINIRKIFYNNFYEIAKFLGGEKTHDLPKLVQEEIEKVS